MRNTREYQYISSQRCSPFYLSTFCHPILHYMCNVSFPQNSFAFGKVHRHYIRLRAANNMRKTIIIYSQVYWKCTSKAPQQTLKLFFIQPECTNQIFWNGSSTPHLPTKPRIAAFWNPMCSSMMPVYIRQEAGTLAIYFLFLSGLFVSPLATVIPLQFKISPQHPPCTRCQAPPAILWALDQALCQLSGCAWANPLILG